MTDDTKKHDAKTSDGDKTSDDSKHKEIGGFESRKEPTRYGDWEVDGRCSDF